MKEQIEFSTLKGFEESYEADKKNSVAMHATMANGILESCTKAESAIANPPQLLHQYIDVADMTNQKKSGRCWMFAALNVMRLEIMDKLNLKNLELSQSYPLFWDKLEKVNHFLEKMLETLQETLEGRVVSYLLKDPLSDGRQWDMFSSLVHKYGVVPKEIMPETKVSTEIRTMNKVLTLKLREFASVLREGNSQGISMEDLRSLKEGQLSTIYDMLCISLGKPPNGLTHFLQG